MPATNWVPLNTPSGWKSNPVTDSHQEVWKMVLWGEFFTKVSQVVVSMG